MNLNRRGQRITARDKHLLGLYKEYLKLSRVQSSAPLIELDEPYQRGWVRFFRLRDDASRREDASTLKEILDKINVYQYCRKGTFTQKNKKTGTEEPIGHNPKRYIVNEWHLNKWPPIYHKYFEIRLVTERNRKNQLEGYHSKTYKSVLLAVEGRNLHEHLDSWKGTVQWIVKSPFRPNHGRKNWFVGVNVFYPPEPGHDFLEKDVRYEAMRASGPGGQHVNKTSSAVRATHLPSGLVAFAQEERSQSMNKKLAVARLCELLQGREQDAKGALQQDVWHRHNCLERGNPVRTYVGNPMRRKR